MRLFEIQRLDEESVFSSWIDELDYDDGNVIMTLLSGRAYQIRDVPYDVFEEWLQASSKGKFFHSDIKGLYDITRY